MRCQREAMRLQRPTPQPGGLEGVFGIDVGLSQVAFAAPEVDHVVACPAGPSKRNFWYVRSEGLARRGPRRETLGMSAQRRDGTVDSRDSMASASGNSDLEPMSSLR
jgi:hypothetical protein